MAVLFTPKENDLPSFFKTIPAGEYLQHIRIEYKRWRNLIAIFSNI
jgi:hypothetical protein